MSAYELEPSDQDIHIPFAIRFIISTYDNDTGQIVLLCCISVSLLFACAPMT